MSDVIVIGHRGACTYAPENSLESFEKAIELGADLIELDVHLTGDREAVVIHDEKIDRTANGRGKVRDMSLETLRTFKLKSGEKIPTLAEVLERFSGQCGFVIDMKAKFAELPVYEAVAEKGLLSGVIFSSTDGTQLLELKVKDKNTRLAFICGDKKMNFIKIATSVKAEAVHLKAKLVKPEVVEKAHSEGLKVNVWTVNRPKKMIKLIDMGVDGIITDRPDVLMGVLKE